MKVEYSSNNSGGRWWLTDADWQAMETAGWTVEWFSNERSNTMIRDGRFLGALASRASKDFTSAADAIRDFERLTGQDASVDGCNCCGPPHSFSWDHDYASGSDVLRLLYDHVPSSLRDACDQIKDR